MVGAKEIFSIKINEEYMTDREYGIFQNIKKMVRMVDTLSVRLFMGKMVLENLLLLEPCVEKFKVQNFWMKKVII